MTKQGLVGCFQDPVLKVAEASRPGSGMYGGNLGLVSRRENIQVSGYLYSNKKTLQDLSIGGCTEGVL